MHRRGALAPFENSRHALPATVRLYDHLFANEDPNIVEGELDYTSNLNPNSLEILSSCQVEPSLADAKPGSPIQFERLGYFCVDEKDAQPGNLVFNRTVTLRDTWAKIEKAMKSK